MACAELVSRRRVLAGAAAAVVGGLAGCRGRKADEASDTEVSGNESLATLPATTSAGSTAAPSTATESHGYFPSIDGEWETVTPAAAGFTAGGMAEVIELVGVSNSQSFVQLHEGRILAEEYWMGATAETTRDVASVQKSVMSTLLGLARDRGVLSFEDTVTDHLGVGWSAARPTDEALITVLHLMTMSSGLHPRTLRKETEPGTVWDYNTDAYQKLRRVLEAAASSDINTMSNEWLFAKIGLTNESSWVPRFSVDAVGDQQWGLRFNAREMARFGLFAANGGSWQGEQITGPSWFAEAWAATPLKRDYGYLWWLLGKGHFASEGAPPDLVAGLGAEDQKIYVSPSNGLVLARQGDAAAKISEHESDFDALLIRALGRARA